MQDVSEEIKRVRAQMEENEQLAVLMRGLRGQNLNDTLFADDNIKLRLVEVCQRNILKFAQNHFFLRSLRISVLYLILLVGCLNHRPGFIL